MEGNLEEVPGDQKGCLGWSEGRGGWHNQSDQIGLRGRGGQWVGLDRVVRVVSLDDMRKIYGFHGLNHQIIGKS